MTYLADLEAQLSAQPNQLAQTALVVFDVDGVLTDGRLYYGAEGEMTKVFHVRDGVGLKLMQDMGIQVAVVTAKDSAMVARRMNELGIHHYFPGCKDKLKTVASLTQSLELSLKQCCFVGDDMVDVPVMREVGVSICPEDAYPLVAEVADMTLDLSGGEGVARRVCDLLLVAQNRFESAYQLASTEAFERNR